MNDQAAKLARWLLAANGALKNIAQLLTESFGPEPVAAATVDPATITAYPVNPAASPIGDHWTRAAAGWAHPLHSALLPRSTSAAHHVLAGVTSRNELLVINLAAAGYLGIEGADPIPMLRSWLMQVLASTPEAHIAVDDPDLAITGAPRITLIPGPAATPADATALFATGHTSGPAAAITVSGQAAGATNVVLCSGPAAGIYLAGRYWPMWRRMELSEAQWAPLAATLTPATPPLTSGDDMSPGQFEPSVTSAGAEPPTAAAGPPQTTLTSDDDMSRAVVAAAEITSEPHPAALEEITAAAAPPTSAPATAQPVLTSDDDMSPAVVAAGAEITPAPHPAGLEEAVAEEPAAAAVFTPPPSVLAADGEQLAPAGDAGRNAVPDPGAAAPAADLPGPPRTPESPLRGLFALGETYALGVDPDTGLPVQHPAVTRQGVRKPIKALMMLATSSGLTTAEWDKELQFNPPNRRQARTTIRKLMGGEDPIREDSRGLLVTDLYCDWKEFQRLAGPVPTQASTENLTAAVALIRGAPFEDIPAGDYGWRSAELLRDELLDRCSDAALELARRQHAAGATTLAYETARLGIRVYPQREDLWEVALACATDSERPGLLYDLKQAIPAPRTPELRQLLAEARTR